MTYTGYYNIPDPEPTDPHVGISASDVVATVAQQLETAGVVATITPESIDAATAHAELLLASLGVLTAGSRT